MYAVPGTAWLLAAGGVFGLGLGALQTAGATYLQEVTPQASLARVLTWMSSATSAASMLGAYLAGLLLEAHVLFAIWVMVLLTAVDLLFWKFGREMALHTAPRGLKLRLWPFKEKERG
jgi:MFS family permease